MRNQKPNVMLILQYQSINQSVTLFGYSNAAQYDSIQ